MLEIGKVMLAEGDSRGAEGMFRRAIEARPALADAHYSLGVVLFDQSKLPEAERESREALRLDWFEITLTGLGLETRRWFLSPADSPLGGTGGLEPLDDALRRLRRRFDLASVAILGVIVGIITPLWIAEPPPMTWYAAANLSIFFFLPPAILFVLGRWGLRRMRSQYARIRPAIRDVGIGFLRGVVSEMWNNFWQNSCSRCREFF